MEKDIKIRLAAPLDTPRSCSLAYFLNPVADKEGYTAVGRENIIYLIPSMCSNELCLFFQLFLVVSLFIYINLLYIYMKCFHFPYSGWSECKSMSRFIPCTILSTTRSPLCLGFRTSDFGRMLLFLEECLVFILLNYYFVCRSEQSELPCFNCFAL